MLVLKIKFNPGESLQLGYPRSAYAMSRVYPINRPHAVELEVQRIMIMGSIAAILETFFVNIYVNLHNNQARQTVAV